MKYAQFVLSEEVVKRLLNLPEDAVIIGITKSFSSTNILINVCGVGEEVALGGIFKCFDPNCFEENGRLVVDCSTPLIFPC